MIDIESIVFDTVYNAVTDASAFPNCRVDAGYVEKSATFPAVSVVETNSVPVAQTATDDNDENYTRLNYEVNIYSAKQDTAKSEARAIAQVVDTAMKTLKAHRSMMHQLPNQDRTIFRLYMRYEVIVKPITSNGEITGYKFYRR